MAEMLSMIDWRMVLLVLPFWLSLIFTGRIHGRDNSELRSVKMELQMLTRVQMDLASTLKNYPTRQELAALREQVDTRHQQVMSDLHKHIAAANDQSEQRSLKTHERINVLVENVGQIKGMLSKKS